jgi:hypothetical protein
VSRRKHQLAADPVLEFLEAHPVQVDLAVVARYGYVLQRMLNETDFGECWLWKGQTSHGYGVLMCFGRPHRIHRLSLEIFSGSKIPKGLDVDHTCHNKNPFCPGGEIVCWHRRCWNPDHLEAITRTENIRRSRRGCFPPDIQAMGVKASVKHFAERRKQLERW